MKRLLITGAFGLVGSNICKVLEKDYPDIEVTKVKFAEFKIYSKERFDFIIFASGYGQPVMFSKDKLATLEINTIFARSLFDYLKPKGKYLFISSSEIYSGAKSPYKETDIGTTTPQHPRACYIEGKRCGEAICMIAREQGYDVKIARLALAYGPGTKKGDTRVLNQFIEQALTKGKIIVHGSSEEMKKVRRTYGYVEDIAEMMLNVLFKGKECVYNVGGGSGTDIAFLAEQIGYQTGADVEFIGNDKMSEAPSDVSLDLTKYFNEFHPSFTPMFNVMGNDDCGLYKTIEYQRKLYATD